MVSTKFTADAKVSTQLKNLSYRIGKKDFEQNDASAYLSDNVKTTVAVQPSPADGPAQQTPYEMKIVWGNVIGFLILHLGGLYGLYLSLFPAHHLTFVWAFVAFLSSEECIVVGAHRYYTHRAFKATFPLRLLLVLGQTVASQNSMWVWVRDHRQHHMHSDTDADPHNASRGFFFSHIGWLMVRKHPAVIAAGRKVDMSDIEADWLVMFQKKYYYYLWFPLAVVLPMLLPVYLWGETCWNSFCISVMLRLIVTLNITWTVNSFAHLYGTRPFDKSVVPYENVAIALLSGGEGWHNYHHTFPWDYRAAEFGSKYQMTTNVIDWFAKVGWAYDLKTASENLVKKRVLRTGDGTHPRYNQVGVPENLVTEPEIEAA